MTKKNILIVGGSSLLGKSFCKVFSVKYNLVTCGRSRVSDDIKHIYMDLSGEVDTAKLPKDIDVVLYLAQSYNFRDFPSSSKNVLQINTISVLDFLNYSKNVGIKQFIYASTGGVYTQNKVHFENDFIDVNKLSGFYATSKYCAEILVNSYKDFFKTTIIRPFFMFGENQKKDMLIPRLVSNIKTNRPIQLQGKNGIEVNPIYVNDAAKIVGKIIDEEKLGVYNVAGDETISLKKICMIIGDVLKKEPIFEYDEKSMKDVIGDFSKIGYEEYTNFEKSINKLI